MTKNWLWLRIVITFFILWVKLDAYAENVHVITNFTKHEAPRKLSPLSWQKTAFTGTIIFAAIAGVSEYINPAVMPVAIGGALGSASRYMISQGVGGFMEQDYPYGTIAVNIIGSFVFGTISGWAGLREETPDSAWITLVTTGFLGGFTTFSTFAHDTVGLAQKNGFLSASLYTTFSVSVAIMAMLAGELTGGYLAIY
jgi:protein CrcB